MGFWYLWQTKDWGLIFWRKEPNLMLPTVHLAKRVLEEADLKFVEPVANMQLAIYVNAAHATDLWTK